MASRIERCSGCGRQLLVLPQTVAIRCSVCQAVTRVRPYNRWDQAYGSVVQAPKPGGRFHNAVNMAAAAGNGSHRGPAGIYGNGFNYYTADGAQPRPALAPPSVYGRKRALLCGVSYNDTNYKLSGSVNDVKRMRFLLVGKLGFPSDCVVTLTEEEKNPRRIPTKQNIRTAMRWLVHDCQPGDSLVFHYSGHGSRQKDYNMDELDGFDETICPLDHETEGPIIDDEINDTIVRQLPRGAKLHAIIDSCYSGTVLDLQFLCRINGEGYYTWEDQRCPAACYRGCYKGTSGGLAVCFSACDDDQLSASAAAFASNEVTGAMTSSFVQALQKEPGLTYGRLLDAMHDAITSLTDDDTDASQEPLLSSSERFDIYSKQVIL